MAHCEDCARSKDFVRNGDPSVLLRLDEWLHRRHWLNRVPGWQRVQWRICNFVVRD